MAIVRVEKNEDYTIMSNYHLRDTNLSLKAIGLLSKILSLPDEWDYSINGLAAISKENETSIRSALKELESFGYVEIRKLMPNESKSGKIEYEYIIYESPQNQGEEKQGLKKQGLDVQHLEVLDLEVQGLENQGQLNTKELNTDKLNTEELNTENIITAQSDKITAEPLPKGEPVIKMPLVSKKDSPTYYLIYQEQVDEWQELYPGVDVMQQLRSMVGWCNANRDRRKTLKGVNRFINAWLDKEQNRSRAPRKEPNKSMYADDFAF